MISKRDILAPAGQKFAIGDLVRATDPTPEQGRPDLVVGELFRIVSSFAQRNPFKFPSAGSDSRVYEIVHVERESTFAWISEDFLELVPE